MQVNVSEPIALTGKYTLTIEDDGKRASFYIVTEDEKLRGELLETLQKNLPTFGIKKDDFARYNHELPNGAICIRTNRTAQDIGALIDALEQERMVCTGENKLVLQTLGRKKSDIIATFPHLLADAKQTTTAQQTRAPITHSTTASSNGVKGAGGTPLEMDVLDEMLKTQHDLGEEATGSELIGDVKPKLAPVRRNPLEPDSNVGAALG